MIRKIHLFCLLFLLLLCMGSVSASEDAHLIDAVPDDGQDLDLEMGDGLHNKGPSPLRDVQSPPSLSASDVDMCYRDGSSFKVKLSDDNKGVAGEVLNITYYSKNKPNNKFYSSLKTNGAGEASMPINLGPGEYNFKTDCILDNQKLSIINTVKIRQMKTSLMADKNVDVPYKEGKYTVSLKDGNGNNLCSKPVIFKVVGRNKEYKRYSDSNGLASLELTGLKLGDHKVYARFVESGYYSSSTDSMLHVKTFKTRMISSPLMSKNKSAVFSLKLVDEYNNPVANRIVSISIHNIDSFFRTDDNGVGRYNLTLPMGNYKISCIFFGSSGYLKSSSSFSVIFDYGEFEFQSNDFETFVESEAYYLVKVAEKDGMVPACDLKSDIYSNGKYVKTISSKIHNDGIARIKLDLNPGEYAIRNYLKSGGNFSENKVTIKPANVIASSSDLTLNRKGELYKVTFKNSISKMGISGKAVTFNVKYANKKHNGWTYKKYTDKNGVASLPLDYANGNYIISYSFDGAKKYANVKGTNKLSMGNYKLSSSITPLNSEIIRKWTFYKVKLSDSNGFGLKNKIVHITVKGTTYKCTTDNDGIAKLRIIYLTDGKYSIKSEFKGNGYYRASTNYNTLNVNTKPNFQYILNLPTHIEHNGVKCTNIREIVAQYNANYNSAAKSYKFCFGENEKGFNQVTGKKSYTITDNGLEYKYGAKPGIGFKLSGNNLQIIFNGKSSDIGQFSVIYTNKGEATRVEYIIDNEVVAKVFIETFYFTNEFNKILDAGYYHTEFEFIDSIFKCEGHEFKRSVQLSSGEFLHSKSSEKFSNFNTIQSYLIDYKKITNSFLEKECNKAVNIGGYYKNAHDYYMAALLTIASSDAVSDNLARQLGVTWNKKYNVVLVNCDWMGITMDAYVPLVVNGDKGNVFKFRVAHGLLFSLCENIGVGSTGNAAKDTVGNILQALDGGKDFVIDQEGDVLTISLVNSTDKIVINLKTGVTATYTSPNIAEMLYGVPLKGGYGCAAAISSKPEYMVLSIVNSFKNGFDAFSDILSTVTPNKVLLSLVAAFNKEVAILTFSFLTGEITINTLLIAGAEIQGFTFEYRNKYAPYSTWQYFASHGPMDKIKTVAVRNPVTQYVDYVEIPRDDRGNLNMDKARYIDSITGKRDLTYDEKVKYAFY